MKHLRQPPGSSCCGQMCLAMLLNVDPEQIFKIIGRGKTHYSTLRRALDHFPDFPMAFGAIIQRRHQEVPDQGIYIASIIWRKIMPHRSHFVVLNNGKVYDPVFRHPLSMKRWLATRRRLTHRDDLDFTSWMVVHG